MISFDEAIERIRLVATPFGIERLRLNQAAGRILAKPVVARIDSPRANVSSMDGYAVRDSDLSASSVSLKVAGESFPGTGWDRAVGAGECVRIFTGAPVPSGADRVVIQENVRREGDMAIFAGDRAEARHIRERGSDFKCSDELLAAGRLLDPRAIVAAGAADLAEVEVYRPPRMQILGTGDELAEPGQAADTQLAVPDSVSLGVAMLAERWGASCIGRTRVCDNIDWMCAAAAATISQADVIVVTGGASVGEKDFAKAMFEPSGLKLIFSTVAIRPGKPVWLGRAGKAVVIGLPGNPTSALVTARLLLAPLLAGMCGQPLEAALDWRPALLGAPLNESGNREIFHRARRNGERVEVLPNQDSGAQKALADAELLVRQGPNSAAVAEGTMVNTLAL